MAASYPHFLGIGAHKAGTSWLHWQLNQHPGVWLPPVKEVHFFDRSEHYPSPSELQPASPLKRLLKGPEQRQRFREGYWRLRQGITERDWSSVRWAWHWYFGHYNEAWYRRLFSRHFHDHLCGEITPAYSMLEGQDVAALREMNPDLKLIFMLRNPIDRAWSSVRFNRERGHSDIELDAVEAILAQLQAPTNVLRGAYLRTLDNYLEYFPAEQILVGFYDAIARDPTGLIHGIADFLELPIEQGWHVDNTKRVNASPWQPMPDAVRRYLAETYRPEIEALAERLGSYAQLWLAGVGGGPCTPDSKPQPVVRLG